jgi:hypothetical protein
VILYCGDQMETQERLPRVFLGIVTAEILAILALYWAGLFFGA